MPNSRMCQISVGEINQLTSHLSELTEENQRLNDEIDKLKIIIESQMNVIEQLLRPNPRPQPFVSPSSGATSPNGDFMTDAASEASAALNAQDGDHATEQIRRVSGTTVPTSTTSRKTTCH